MDPFVGEIRCFAFGQVPRGWMACNGQLLPLMPYQVLFSLLGIQFGGDGKTTFGLPDLQGRVPVHMNTVGTPPLTLGTKGGSEMVTLTADALPAHTHLVQTNSAAGTSISPQAGYISGLDAPHLSFGANANLVPMALDIVVVQGGGTAHNNMQPFLVVGFYIATMGLYPMRP